MKTKFFSKILLNLLFVAITLGVISLAYQNVESYKWVYSGLLKGNYDITRKHKNLTVDQKYEIKIGFDYAFMRFIRENTPADAVIFMPGPEVFYPEGKETPFKSGKAAICNHIWKLRFLYPRKIVNDNDTNNKYRDMITHVAIVNGWGYQKLNYEVDKQEPFTILPIKNR